MFFLCREAFCVEYAVRTYQHSNTSLQVLVLLIQYYKGPRFFVPARFLPEKYDYYRRVPAAPVVSLHLRFVVLT
jgi:hypothetical protein